MLWLTIIDEWLGCDGLVFVIVVLLGYLIHMRFVWFLGELLLERSFVKGEYVGLHGKHERW